MLAKLFMQYLLATVFGVGVDEGYATRFGDPDDPHKGGNLACEHHRPVPTNEPVCAHRWLPCGTQVVIENLERPGRTTCRVSDRGPYGVDAPSGRWRGVLDLTPHVARAVKLDGWDNIRMIYRLPTPGHPAYDDPTWLAPRRRSRSAM
jgi:hypothetical protein